MSVGGSIASTAHLLQQLQVISILFAGPLEERDADHRPSSCPQQPLTCQILARWLQGVGGEMMRSISFNADLLPCICQVAGEPCHLPKASSGECPPTFLHSIELSAKVALISYRKCRRMQPCLQKLRTALTAVATIFMLHLHSMRYSMVTVAWIDPAEAESSPARLMSMENSLSSVRCSMKC